MSAETIRADITEDTEGQPFEQQYTTEEIDGRFAENTWRSRVCCLLLLRELKSHIDPLGPDNKLVFATVR